jgi:hypothetical protein
MGTLKIPAADAVPAQAGISFFNSLTGYRKFIFHRLVKNIQMQGA